MFLSESLLIFRRERNDVLKHNNLYFFNGTAYAGKSTMVKLLAEKYDGVACEENYHDVLVGELSSDEFPNLTYTRDLKNWSEFVRRTPEQYEEWINGVTKECTILELRLLEGLAGNHKKVFVYCRFANRFSQQG